jgi:hypothetical protein
MKWRPLARLALLKFAGGVIANAVILAVLMNPMDAVGQTREEAVTMARAGKTEEAIAAFINSVLL